jgi:predicted DCC family thiol-disulfide oxidoreductase YuxK
VSAPGPRARVLYDLDCGFCRWTLGWVLRWDRGRALEPIPLQDPRARELLAPMRAERTMASWHLVAADGSVTSAGAAAAPLLRLLPGGRPLAAIAARAPRAVNWGYDRIAHNRSRLGPLVTAGAKARADRVIAARRGEAARRPSARA